MDKPELHYEKHDYAKVIKDGLRFDPRAYDFILDVTSEVSEQVKRHVNGRELLEYFRDLTLDAFGPLSYDVLADWGLTCCEDVGAVVMQLCNAGLLKKQETDSEADFIGGFDFKEEFLGPFAI